MKIAVGYAACPRTVACAVSTNTVERDCWRCWPGGIPGNGAHNSRSRCNGPQVLSRRDWHMRATMPVFTLACANCWLSVRSRGVCRSLSMKMNIRRPCRRYGDQFCLRTGPSCDITVIYAAHQTLFEDMPHPRSTNGAGRSICCNANICRRTGITVRVLPAPQWVSRGKRPSANRPDWYSAAMTRKVGISRQNQF